MMDDADALGEPSEDTAEFFTFHVPQTKTKVLLTSCRMLFGMGNTTIYAAGYLVKTTLWSWRILGAQ